MERLVDALIRRRWLIAGLVLAIAGYFASFAPQVEQDNSIGIWFVENDPSYQRYLAFQDEFGGDDVVAIAYHRPPSVFTEPALNAIRTATRRLEALDGIADVISIATELHVETRGHDVLVVEPIMDGDRPLDAAAVAEVRTRVRANPLFSQHVISPDETTTLIVSRLRPGDDERRNAILMRIREIAAETLETGAGHTALAGMLVSFATLNEASRADRRTYLTLGLAVMIAALIWAVRSPVFVAASLIAVLASVGFSSGLTAATGHSENMVTLIVPALIMILGIANCIHLITHFQHQRARHPADAPARAAARALTRCLAPCAFTALTTAAAFLSLLAAKMAVVQDLGAFAAAGVMGVFAVSVVVCAATFGIPGARATGGGAGHGGLARAVAWCHRAAVARPGLVVGVGAAVTLVGAAGIPQLRADNYSIQYLYADHPLRRDSDFIEQRFGYYLPLEYVASAPGLDGWQSPEYLRRLQAFQDRVEELDGVSKATSLTHVVRRVNQVFEGGAESEYRIPDTEAAVAQELLFYSMDSDSDLDRLVDTDLRRARVTFRIRNESSRWFAGLIEQIDRIAERELGPELQAVASGYIPLYVKLVEYVIATQVRSFALAFASVFLLVLALFRSPRLTLLSLFPNLFPIVLVLGLMGWARIRLDLATVLVAAIALGVAVDGTIHFLFRYREELRAADGDRAAAVGATLASTGVAIVSASLIVSAGFFMLCLGSVKSVAVLGLLIATTLLAALLGDVLVLPALLMLAPGLGRARAAAPAGAERA